MKRVVLCVILCGIFLQNVCFAWSTSGWNTGARFLRSRDALFIYDADEGIWKSNKPISYGSDESFIEFGGDGVRFQLDTIANNQLVIGTPVGSAAGSGYISMMVKDHIGTNNRLAANFTANPTLRIYSSDSAVLDDYIDLYHDTTNGVFKSQSGAIKQWSRNGAFLFHTGTGDTLGFMTQGDVWQNQLVLHLNDVTGNQLVICANNGFDDYAHPATVNPTLFIHSDTDVSSTGITNEWLSISHNKTEPLFNSGKGAFTFNRLELPQSSPAQVASDGEVMIDFTDGKLAAQWGAAHPAFSVSTDVVLGSVIQSESLTVSQPDQVYAVNPIIPLMRVDASEFPHGIEITGIYLTKSDAVTATTIVLEKWNSPSDASPAVLHVFSAVTADESSTAAPSEGTVEAGKIVMVRLDSANLDYINIKIEYFEPVN